VTFKRVWVDVCAGHCNTPLFVETIETAPTTRTAIATNTNNDLFTTNPLRFLDAIVTCLSIVVILLARPLESIACALLEPP
jgi:hypothetical protein